MCQSISCTEHLSFSVRVLYSATRFLSLLTCFSLEFSVAFHLVSEFLFFVLFWMLWMLVTVNNALFSLWKTLITFSKIPTLGWMLVILCKMKFASRKILITFTCSLIYARLLPPLLFSLKHMACHVFTHEISNCNKYFLRNVSSVCSN